MDHRTPSQLIQIAQKEKELSKMQIQFNKKIERLHKLKAEHEHFEKWAPFAKGKVLETLVPLEREHAKAKVQLVMTLDFHYDDSFFKPQEKRTLSEFIERLSYTLIQEYGIEELKPIFEKHTGFSFDKQQTEELNMMKEMMKKQAKSQFGVDIDFSDIESNSQEDFMAQATAKLFSHLEEQMGDEPVEAKKKPKGKQQEKQAIKEEKKEEKQKEEAKSITKTVKTIYNELVKKYHPDLEPNEAEALRKTAIMQQITGAYEKNDLFTLLRLKLDLEGANSDHLEKLTDQQLGYYNKLLQEQIAELDISLSMFKNPPPPFDKYRPFILCKTAQKLEDKIQQEADNMRLQTFITKREAESYSDKKTVRKMLKELKAYF